MTTQTVNWDLVPDEFVIYDLETTGLDSYYDEILEIGAIRFRKSDYIATGQIDTFQTFIKPTKPISKEITAINSITNEMVADGVSLNQALEDFFAFSRGHHLVAFNAKFDMKFIRNSASKVEYKLPRPFKTQCALELAREKLTGVPNYKLKTLAEIFKVDTTGAHRAVNDCVMTLHVYINCLNATDGLTYRGKQSNNSGSQQSTYKSNSSVFGYLLKELFTVLGMLLGLVIRAVSKKRR
jgi:DNA polymerase III epsilon subunit family exonuclease